MAFLVQTFSKAFTIAGYYANTASFAKNCENKAKPVMHCNGKCQMMKKLTREDNTEKQNQGSRADSRDDVLSHASFFPSIHVALIVFENSYFPVKPRLAVNSSSRIFHPPQL